MIAQQFDALANRTAIFLMPGSLCDRIEHVFEPTKDDLHLEEILEVAPYGAIGFTITTTWSIELTEQSNGKTIERIARTGQAVTGSFSFDGEYVTLKLMRDNYPEGNPALEREFDRQVADHYRTGPCIMKNGSIIPLYTRQFADRTF